VDGWKLNDVDHVDGAIYGAQMAYEGRGNRRKKAARFRLVNLKWPEGEKDTEPEEKALLAHASFRDKAPSSPAALDKPAFPFAFYDGGITAPKRHHQSA